MACSQARPFLSLSAVGVSSPFFYALVQANVQLLFEILFHAKIYMSIIVINLFIMFYNKITKNSAN
jgi:hypothetical protein